MILDPGNLTPTELQGYLQSAVAPRPIALVSTVDAQGKVNLSPFSFFNCFSISPPILVFSPSRRVRDNTTKHTLENVREVKEVVIQVVSHAMVEQTSLASTEYEKDVNEFTKAGFSEEPSIKVKPPRVKEAPVAFECKVLDIIALGDGPGAGNLVVCEVLLIHCKDEFLNEKKTFDPDKLDLVARMGDNWYSRASGDSLFEIPKPLQKKGIGVDQLPESIRFSKILTGNNLGRLANVESLPSEEEIAEAGNSTEVKKQQEQLRHETDVEIRTEHFHRLAKRLLEEGKTAEAWKILLWNEKRLSGFTD
jgi:flavin reductase (DIM6/NTAB) family NADH-FMN oxidoreductase RutF